VYSSYSNVATRICMLCTCCDIYLHYFTGTKVQILTQTALRRWTQIHSLTLDGSTAIYAHVCSIASICRRRGSRQDSCMLCIHTATAMCMLPTCCHAYTHTATATSRQSMRMAVALYVYVWQQADRQHTHSCRCMLSVIFRCTAYK
jgi:hypothetical protein